MTISFEFTERVRRVLHNARTEAATIHHEYVGTEHILLALLNERDGVADGVLNALNTDRKAVRQKILNIVKAGKSGPPTGSDLPYTSRAKRVLELAMSESRHFNHNYVGTEHLLAGLLGEEKGVAAQTLIGEGITLPKLREEIVRLLATKSVGDSSGDSSNSSDMSSIESSSSVLPTPRKSGNISAIEMITHFDDGTKEHKVFQNITWARRYLDKL